jgi:LacI family transcriptional regulator, galactose operon repressor
MRHVAEAAGVSLKTVSRVVNGEAGVGAATATRVLETIAALGFRRNDLARSLRHGRSSATLGLVIGDLTNPFYSAIARAAEQVAGEHDYLLITASCEEDPERERELVSALSSRRVDGLLLVPATGADHAYLDAELAAGTRVVFLDRPPTWTATHDGHATAAAKPEGAGTLGGYDVVMLDNVGGARRGTEHLLAQGHRRIGVIGDTQTLFTAAERVAGYRAALATAGVEVDERLLRLGRHDDSAAREAAHELLTGPDPPTALLTLNNRSSVGALRALASQPPGGGGRARVALVGFDDFELADLLPVAVTVIRHDPAELGRRAAELLFARLSGDRRPPQRVVLPTELVVRGSGEVAP